MRYRKQTNETNCGPTCLVNLAKSLGYNVGQKFYKVVASQLRYCPKKGVEIKHLHPRSVRKVLSIVVRPKVKTTIIPPEVTRINMELKKGPIVCVTVGPDVIRSIFIPKPSIEGIDFLLRFRANHAWVLSKRVGRKYLVHNLDGKAKELLREKDLRTLLAKTISPLVYSVYV